MTDKSLKQSSKLDYESFDAHAALKFIATHGYWCFYSDDQSQKRVEIASAKDIVSIIKTLAEYEKPKPLAVKPDIKKDIEDLDLGLSDDQMQQIARLIHDKQQ